MSELVPAPKARYVSGTPAVHQSDRVRRWGATWKQALGSGELRGAGRRARVVLAAIVDADGVERVGLGAGALNALPLHHRSSTEITEKVGA